MSRLLTLTVLTVLVGCDYVAYDITATGRPGDRYVGGADSGDGDRSEDPTGDGGLDGGWSDDGGPSDDGGDDYEWGDPGDYGYEEHAEPSWIMPDSPGRHRCLPPADGSSAPCPRNEALAEYPDEDVVRRENVPEYDTSVAGVAVDSVTGLMWEQQPDLSRKRAFQDAREHCFRRTTAGFRDWRLPTRIELVTLFDLNKADEPLISSRFGNTPSDPFWTLSTLNGGSSAWQVAFSYRDALGNVQGYMKHVPIETGLGWVRCVR